MKRVDLVAVSSRPPPWAGAAEEEYRRRIRCFTVSLTTIKPRASPQKESAALLTALSGKLRHCVLLHPDGDAVNSRQFAALLQTRLREAPATVFVIGGADGVGDELADGVGLKLSLSPLTFPHALARLILIEQLFRADCLMRNHPYPR